VTFPAAIHWFSSARALRGVAAAVVVLALAGCAVAPLHQSVPADKVEKAEIEGFSSAIRYWADEAPPDIEARIHRRLMNYRAAYAEHFRTHGSYPPMHYLAISGGAYDGAFGAGLLTGWTQTGKRPAFTMVTGVSTGALIAPFVFLGPEYDDTLRELFTTSDSRSIFEASITSVFDGITGGLALTRNAPLAEKIRRTITPEVMERIAQEHAKGKRLMIGTTNMEAQRGVIWDIGEIASSGNSDALALIHRIMLASAAVPGLFEPVFIEVALDGKYYTEIHVDGGVTSQVFVYPMRLPRAVIDEFEQYRHERHLYIVRNSKVTPEYQPIEPGLFSLSRRSLETLTKYQGVGDLYRLYVMAQRDGMDYNVAFIPQSFSAESKEIFDPYYMSQLFAEGKAMAQRPDAWMKQPPGVAYAP
jgi:predicted acylesterase/phospholipase RssA